MYRRLVLLWLLLYALVPLVWAYIPPKAAPALARLVELTTPHGPAAGGTVSLVLSVLIGNLAPLVLGIALTWLSAFDPGRRPRPWEVPLRGLGALALAVYAVGLLLLKGQAAATAGVLLAGQIGRPPWLVLTAAQGPHWLIEGLAFGLIFSVPLFWAIRTPQVRSFARTSFEAWAEVRRLAIPALLLIALAAMIEVFVSPTTTAMLLR